MLSALDLARRIAQPSDRVRDSAELQIHPGILLPRLNPLLGELASQQDALGKAAVDAVVWRQRGAIDSMQLGNLIPGVLQFRGKLRGTEIRGPIASHARGKLVNEGR